MTRRTMITNVARALVLAAAFALGTSRPCDAVTFLGAARQASGASTLYSISSDDGTATSIGPIGFVDVSGMDFDATGTLYATGRRPGDGTHVLIMIDPATGEGTEVGPTGIELFYAENSSDISFRPSDGTLYAYTTPFHDLATIDTSTGAATLIAPSGGIGCCGNGIAFVGTTLYQANDEALITLDQATGDQSLDQFLVFSPPADEGPDIAAMDASPAGTLVAIVESGVDSSEGYLAVIGQASGNVRVIGPTQAGMDAFAIPPGVTFDADADPPICTPDPIDVPSSHVEFTIQDLDGGLGTITVALATNADCAVSPFTPGTTDPVVVTCDAITAHQLAVVQIQATDVDGNTHDCDVTYFNVEATSPFCFASAALVGPPAQVEFGAVDDGSGLALVQTPVAINVLTTAPFTVGTTDVVTLFATPANPSLASSIQFEVFDQDGNSISCPPTTFQHFALAKKGSLQTSFTNVSHTTPRLTVKNGATGFTRLKVAIGSFRKTVSLADGQMASFDLAGQLTPGSNTVYLQAWGKAGSSMSLFAFPSFAP